MASDLSSGCTETIDILDEKEEGEISLEDVSSSEEGGIGHLTSGYVVKTRRPCPNCKSARSECTSWCSISSKMTKDDRSKSQNKRDPVKGKENRHRVNETGCTTAKHALSTLQEKNDDLVPISSDSDMEIVGLAGASKQLVTRSNARIKKKKKKKKKEYLTVDDLISPSSVDLSIAEYSSDSREMAVGKRIYLSRPRYGESSSFRKSGRSRVISKSPLRRYRSPVRARSPFSSPLSPLSRSRSPPLRRSPRRLRSPRRSSSPHRSPARTVSRQLPRLNPSPSPSSRASHTYVDRYGDVTRLLLKKVKHLDSVGAHATEPGVNRGKGHQSSSLKEKLSNMMRKEAPDGNVTRLKEKCSVQPMGVNDADDEEDLALLRQKALETKQKNRSNKPEHPTEAESGRKPTVAATATATTRTNDDEDEEDLELRMIALRSAVMKKHQNRVQRGVRAARNKKATVCNHSESPFTQSFLDNIPIPGDELLKFASPPCTPPLMLSTDSNNIEDMELDTDVEREKEKLPYSPTDRITVDVPIDTELLGIDPSDVSFINLNNADNNPISVAVNDESKSISIGTVSPYRTYLKPNYESSPKRFAYSPPPHDGDECFHADLNNDQRELPSYLKNLHGDSIECDLIDGICCQGDAYSSTITPTYEEAGVTSRILPITTDLPASSSSSNHTRLSPRNVTGRFSDDLLTHVDSTSKEQSSSVQVNKSAYETVSGCPVTDSPAVSALGSASPNGSMVTIDDLPETDGDPVSPAVINRHVSPAADYIPRDEVPCQADGTAREPLYIQGVPDVTKDVNKIPTLINRTLVPAPILKSNKQLQQPLPRKHETQPEPTFKSAEMQPVVITADTNARSSTSFKPIKLVPFAKKSHPVLTMPVVFDDPTNENLQNDTPISENHETAESRHSASDTATANSDTVPARKKRKRAKKNRRKGPDIAVTLERRENNSRTYDVNKNVNTTTVTSSIPQQRIAEPDKKRKSNDDNKTRGSLMENEELSGLQKEPLLPIDPGDVTIDNAKTNDQRVTLNDKEEPKHVTTSNSNECQQETNIESSRCLSTSSDAAAAAAAAVNKATEVTKDDTNNRRQSMDEDEDELRAILLASLAKRVTKPSDTSGIPAVSITTVATNCNTTDMQLPAQKTLTDTAPATVSNNAPLPSTLNSPEVNEGRSQNITATKEADGKPVSSPGGNRKRSNTTAAAKGPLKKIIKKAPISASTKVVNNAKKYQNTIVQRKLNNLQKHDTNAHNNNNKRKPKQDNVWSANMPTKTSMKIHASETQRIVINLGSDTDSESESERCSIVNARTSSSSTASTQDTNIDFEKNLDKFLRDVRKEQESAAMSKPASSPQQTTRRDTPPVIQQTDQNKDASNMHTPLAVRHLPASQQEEYRRLKQQILEREKLKLQRKIINHGSMSNNKLLNNAPSPLAKSLLPYDKESTSVKQDQVKLREPERNSQQSPTEIKTKNVDVTKSTPTLNTSRASGNKIVSANIAKQTNSIHPPAKGAKKSMPNISIRITNEIAPTYATAEGKTIEGSVERQSTSDEQLRPTLRTLSKDEINRKHVQIQLKQDTTGRVVTINDKVTLEHNAASAGQNEKPVGNDNASAGSPNERTINRNIDVSTDSQFYDASTVILNSSSNSDASKQELDTMETTMSRSQYEREREIACNSALSSEDSSHNDNNGACKSSKINTPNDKGNTDDIWSALKRYVKTELDSLARLPEAEQRRHLSDTEDKLVARRYTVLDYLAEMSGNLRQWDMEKDLYGNLTDEVKKLKEQLRIAEEKLQMQRNRVSSMGPKISTARQKINAERRECFKLSRICSALGNRFIGKDYKLPEAGDQLLSNKLKEIANHTRQLSKKKSSSNDILENSILFTSPPQASSLSELSKITHAEEDLSLQKLDGATVANGAVGSQSDTSHLGQSNDAENLNISQVLSNQVTPARKDQASAVIPNEQGTPNEDNVLLSEPKLTSTPVGQDGQCTPSTRETDVSESELSATDFPLHQDNKQRNDERMPAMTTTTTTAMTATTTITITATTTTTIAPYVSILTHLKTPRNTNPNGILCPYDLMGVCNDGGCQFVHQSTSHT